VVAEPPQLYARAVPVDVVTEIVIGRARDDVAAYASDPDNAPAWYENIKAVEWLTARPLVVGTRIAFVARFLGRRLAYTYEVSEIEPGRRFVMGTSEGPFPMETIYSFEDASGGATRMTLRNRGAPTRFGSPAARLISRAMRRANRKDLARLKKILES
jgi:uncharacterized membrane protein